jgi:LPXTG-site transpeptidase (sortase) family protein
MAASDPSKLIIPSLGINANVQQVGLTANGNMGVPTGKYKWQDVAWYRLGPKPGEIGNAVIDGHLDNAISLKAVFYNLDKLNTGDEVDVQDIDGVTHRFRVVEKASYDYKNAPLDKIFGPTDKAMLVLITCGGTWIQSQRSYDKRLVVYTELIR